MKRVLVIGAGPAGLAAGVKLKETAGNAVSVTIAHMGHHFGGKAASYTDAKGRLIEHGWHMFVGFYEKLPALLKRAGGSMSNAVMSMSGKQHVYEPSRGKIYTLDSAGGRITTALNFARYDGLSFRPRPLRTLHVAGVRAPAGRRGAHAARRRLLHALGDRERPAAASHAHEPVPHLPGGTSESAETFAAVAPYSERVWDPIAKYFESLGGTFLPYTMLRGFAYDGRRVTGLHVARPDANGHAYGASPWQSAELPIEAGTESTMSDFDAVIVTVPQAVFLTLNKGDARMWQSPYFFRMKNLRSGSTVSMTVRTKNPCMPFVGPVFGFPAPLGISTNMTRYLERYRKGGEPGNEIQLVGQEKGFESWTDDEIVSFTLDNFARIPGCDMRAAEITYLELHRSPPGTRPRGCA